MPKRCRNAQTSKIAKKNLSKNTGWREGRVKGRLIWNLLVISLSFQAKIWLRLKVEMSDEIKIQMDLKDGEGWKELQLSFLSDRYLDHNAGL